MKDIVIVTSARCGSSWLVNSFGSTGYNEMPLALSPYNNTKNLNIEERISILKKERPFVTKVFTDGIIDLELLNENTEFIWLYRRNKVEHFLSQIICIRTNTFNIKENENYTTPDIFDITDEEVDLYENILNCENNALKKYNYLFSHYIAYEDLFTKNPWGFKQSKTKPVKLNNYSPELLEKAKQKLNERGIKWQM